MTTISELTVEIEGKEVGLSALLQKVDQQTQKAADSAIKLQQQYARLAAAQGNTAGASKILSGALVNNGGASEQAVVGVATQLTKLDAGLQSGATYAEQFGGALKSQLLGLVGPAALAGTAVGALKGAVDLAQVGAQLQGTERSFQSLSAAAGQSSTALLSSLRAAAAGTIADAKLMESANTGLLLSNGRIAKDLPRLITIARASAQATGQDIGFIFDSLVRGISRGSPQIIDNAGITLDASKAFETYAASIGKSADQLTKQEQQQATLNAVVAAGGDIIKNAGLAADSNAQSYAAAGTALENFKNKAAELASNGLAPAARGLAVVTNGLTEFASKSDQANAAVAKAFSGAKTFDDYGKRIGFVTEQLASIGVKTQPLTEAQFNYARSLESTGVSAGQAIAQALAFNDTLVLIGRSQAALSEGGAGAAQIDAISQAMVRVGQSGAAGAALVEGLTTQIQQNSITAEQAAAALAGFEQSLIVTSQAALVSADAEDRRAEAMRGSLIAQQASAAASINDAAAKQATTAQSQLLEAQIQAVAQSYLALNPNIDAAGVASAVAAGKIDAAVGVYINIALATARARAELAALQGQAGVKGGAASVSEGRSERDRPGDLAQARAAGLAAERQRADAATAAEARYQQALGNNGPAIRRANAELATLKKGSEAYYNKLAELEGLKKKPKGGGGGTKLTDQQKLNNTLLADQQKFNDQYEDVDLKHAQSLLKIQQDYQEKLRQAQQQFDQDNLEGRASFYDNLGNIESDKIRQAASQQYEAAAAEAGQIAAQKGADVADKYMQAQEQVISARAKRLAEIEKASKEKDAGKAEYLKGVDEAYRKAEDAKLARIKDGDGSIAADRDKQIQDENQKYEESQGKIADSAERAADRKIAAADRAGKKIDEEQAKAATLAATYDKIAAAGAPTSGGAPVAPGSTPTAAPGPGAPADPLAAAIDGAREAIVAALAAIERATRETTGAVRNLKANGGVAG